MRRLVCFIAALLAVGAFPPIAVAQDGEVDLATAATNPVGAVNQLQLQYSHAGETNNSDGNSDTFVIQPVLSFDLPDGGYFEGMVARVTLPYIWTPEIPAGPTTLEDDGFGDLSSLFIFHRTIPGQDPAEFTSWGPVLSVRAPTASSDLTGTDDWGAGPGFLWIRNDKYANSNQFMYGALAWHNWDIDGDTDTSLTSAIAVGIYKFDSLFDQKGWYLRYPDDPITYDWETDELTQVPIGAFLGRAFTIGKQPVNVFGGGWYNAADPDNGTAPEWNLKLSFSLVFPK